MSYFFGPSASESEEFSLIFDMIEPGVFSEIIITLAQLKTFLVLLVVVVSCATLTLVLDFSPANITNNNLHRKKNPIECRLLAFDFLHNTVSCKQSTTQIHWRTFTIFNFLSLYLLLILFFPSLFCF